MPRQQRTRPRSLPARSPATKRRWPVHQRQRRLHQRSQTPPVQQRPARAASRLRARAHPAPQARALRAREYLPAAARRVLVKELWPAKAKLPLTRLHWPARPLRVRAREEIAFPARALSQGEARPLLIKAQAPGGASKAPDRLERFARQQLIPPVQGMAPGHQLMRHASVPAEEHMEQAGFGQAPGTEALLLRALAPHNGALPPEVADAQAHNSVPMSAA
jgi:hypothetical protein